MATFVDSASAMFPGVQWTGGSHIHVSFARDWFIGIPAKDYKTILTLLKKQEVGWSIWRLLNKNFDKFVWLITGEEFVNLYLVDCYRHLKGKPDSESPNKLKNPSTGNRFHHIALIEDYIAGVRFWCDDYCGTQVNMGFRFRVERVKEEEEDVRRRVRERVMEAQGEIEVVLDDIIDVKEPTKEQEQQVETITNSID